ncbi:phosphatase PAP2 family protein [Pseudalkalibacillus hwajinpoensis]|uniref:phosphatase PAP2 family protein n=1 Tax=Guptibacillus hwajinpoensis TaxID=208199 RepID=UPI00146A5132|nr:phosphatase PAP2 family protein [Pseudalkalibacillus hwajinpoensis]
MIEVIQLISELASKPAIILITLLSMVVLWLWKKDYVGMITLFVFVFVGNLTNKLLKNLIQRERPLIEGHIVEGYSFPSGHVMVGLIMYGLIVYYIFHYTHNAFIKIITLSLAILLMTVIGFSRIIMLEHFLTDVLAGYCLGGLMLMMGIIVYRYLFRRFHKSV